MAAREAAHERVSTFLVSSDRAQASGNEIREALESSNDEAKVEAMEKAIAALLAGEQLPALFITIVRYVLPSENHQVQKLLLLYLETIEKTDANGKLLPEMILICQNLRNSLQHPNEFIRGVTLRFLTRIREEELLEPLVHSVLANLEHRHSYVRKNAVLALDAIWKLPRGELLAPDAPEVVERLLAGEADLSTRRNAFHLLVNHARDRAVAYLLSNADRVAEWGDVLQIAALDLTRRVCGDDPAQRPRFLKVVLALLQARSTAVVYEAAVTLSDNNVRLIVLDRLEELAARHPEVMREALMGVLRALAAPDLDVRRKALDLALDLVTLRSVEEVVGVLRKEYRALLVAALHACAARFPAVAGAVLDGLADFLGDASAAAALDVAHFLRELAETNPELRPAALDRAIEGFPAVRAPRVAGAVLWILAEYCTSREDIHRVIQLVKECVGRLPLVPGEGEEAADGGGEEGRDAPASPAAASVAGPIARSRPAVLADGSYATQTALPGSPHGGALAGGHAAAPGVPHLRAALLAGDGFLAGILAASLTKLVLRLRTTRALPAPALNALTAELMLLVASALRACEAAAAADGGAGEGPDADALERAPAARASRPDVGSSMKTTEGLATSSTARVRRLRCSTDSPDTPGEPTKAPRRRSSSTRVMTSSTNASRVAASTVVGRRRRALNWQASCTVACGMWMSVCSTYPITRAKVRSCLGCPFTRMSPVITPSVLRPASTSISVVLPAPDAPISAVSTWGRKAPLMFFSRRSWPACGPSPPVSALPRSRSFGRGTE
ncbi:Coatomer subunit beta-1 [Auxenochlorella protothecoides]|uniref:Coatomer subunit beta-1 n=1 Tax=Auxenochlorella protothecoides TaxID=3075 RepID=A0A087SRS7_AUXPR|nr:Coatomer subunit beta-1 [Auxenochlorella protothecoides]KFM28431.1 Coatomer subunit beta-1 [Auxenochlorella protothecoides]